MRGAASKTRTVQIPILRPPDFWTVHLGEETVCFPLGTLSMRGHHSFMAQMGRSRHLDSLLDSTRTAFFNVSKNKPFWTVADTHLRLKTVQSQIRYTTFLGQRRLPTENWQLRTDWTVFSILKSRKPIRILEISKPSSSTCDGASAPRCDILQTAGNHTWRRLEQ